MTQSLDVGSTKDLLNNNYSHSASHKKTVSQSVNQSLVLKKDKIKINGKNSSMDQSTTENNNSAKK